MLKAIHGDGTPLLPTEAPQVPAAGRGSVSVESGEQRSLRAQPFTNVRCRRTPCGCTPKSGATCPAGVLLPPLLTVLSADDVRVRPCVTMRRSWPGNSSLESGRRR
jgi:hypothetical protein